MSETQFDSAGRVLPESIAHIVSMAREPPNPLSVVEIPVNKVLEPLVSPCRKHPKR